MAAHLDRSTSSSSVLFSLSKLSYLPLITLHSIEIQDQSAPVTLVRHLYRSTVAFVTVTSLSLDSVLVSILFLLLQIFRHFYFSRLLHFRQPLKYSVLGFTVTCRSCLVRQVTNHLSAMEWATMKCTRQVIKTLIVPVRRGVRQLPIQWMRIQGRRN